MANDVTRSMPCNIEAEQYVLGAILFDNECIGDVVSVLKPEDFYLEQHKRIFEAMVNISNKAVPIDLVTLKSELESIFDNIGGTDYIAQICLMVNTTANLKYHIKIIEEKAILRKLIRSTSEITELCFDSDKEVALVLNNAENKLYEVLQSKKVTDMHPIKNVLVENLSRLEELMKQNAKVTGVPTGFRDLDIRTTGLQPSDLVLIAARPAMGKTSFALNIATNAAVKFNVPVAIFSLEMSKEQLANRILSSEALISSEKLRTAEIDNDDMAKLAGSINILSKAPIYIDDTAGITVSEIKAKCRRLKMKNQLGLVVIDYLQLIQGNSKEGRQQEVSENSRFLKIMAKELDVPVITLSQLSRAPDQRTDHHPMLSDLRESGSIEQDADMVMFLYREDYYEKETERKNIVECIIAKFRNGSTGTVDLGWRGEFTKFMNLENNLQDPGF